jgi:hypothetical protein
MQAELGTYWCQDKEFDMVALIVFCWEFAMDWLP